MCGEIMISACSGRAGGLFHAMNRHPGESRDPASCEVVVRGRAKTLGPGFGRDDDSLSLRIRTRCVGLLDLPRRIRQLQFAQHHPGLRAIAYAQAVEDGGQVRLDGALLHVQAVGDLLVQQALRHQGQYAELLR